MIRGIEGKTFGFLTAIKNSHSHRNQRMWLCKCQCGKYVFIPVWNLINGHTKSCGCFKGMHIKIALKYSSNGYIMVRMPTHPKATRHGFVREHVLIAESILGRTLKGSEQIHHVDGNPSNNSFNNLVICPDMSFHKLLHIRQRAHDACGNPNWRKCRYCQKYDEQSNLYMYKEKPYGFHHACHNIIQNERYHLRKKGTVESRLRALQ